MNSNSIDWEQVRVDAAINIMNAILSSSLMVFIIQFLFRKQVSDIAVSYADKLIEELKKGTEQFPYLFIELYVF